MAYGQKSAEVRRLEQQRKETLADIEQMDKLLQETTQSAKTSLNHLNLLSRKILSRNLGWGRRTLGTFYLPPL